MNRNRHPAGTPQGGRFSPGVHAEGEIDLDDPTIAREVIDRVRQQSARMGRRYYDIDVSEIESFALTRIVERAARGRAGLAEPLRHDETFGAYVNQVVRNAAYEIRNGPNTASRRQRIRLAGLVADQEARLGRGLTQSEVAKIMADNGITEFPHDHRSGSLDAVGHSKSNRPERSVTDASELGHDDGAEFDSVERAVSDGWGDADFMAAIDRAIEAGEVTEGRYWGRRAPSQRVQLWPKFAKAFNLPAAHSNSVPYASATRMRRVVKDGGGVKALCRKWRDETISDEESNALFSPYGGGSSLSFQQQSDFVDSLDRLPAEDMASETWNSALFHATRPTRQRPRAETSA